MTLKFFFFLLIKVTTNKKKVEIITNMVEILKDEYNSVYMGRNKLLVPETKCLRWIIFL